MQLNTAAESLQPNMLGADFMGPAFLNFQRCPQVCKGFCLGIEYPDVICVGGVKAHPSFGHHWRFLLSMAEYLAIARIQPDLFAKRVQPENSSVFGITTAGSGNIEQGAVLVAVKAGKKMRIDAVSQMS